MKSFLVTVALVNLIGMFGSLSNLSRYNSTQAQRAGSAVNLTLEAILLTWALCLLFMG